MSTQKRVLQVSPAYFPAISIGGPIFTNLTFSKALEDINCHVEVLSTTQGLSQDQIKELPSSQPSTSEFSYPIWRFPYYGYANYTFSPGLFIWLLRHVQKFDLVILQAVWNFPIMAAYLACKWNNIPFVIIPHGSLYDATFHLKSSKFKKLFFSIYVKNMLLNAKKVIFSTRDEEIKVRQFLSLPFHSSIIPNIVEVQKFEVLPLKGTFRQKFNISSNRIILTHFGRVTVKKGINFVLDILPNLIQQYPDLLYVIAGSEEDHYLNELNEIIEKNHLQRHVCFTGLLSPKDGIELLVDTDVFVLPSLSENFGMSVVEAMLCEIPVVISDQVGIALDLKENQCGYVIQLNDSSLENAIVDLIEDPSKRLKLGKKGRDFVKNQYSYEAVEQQLTRLIHS